MQVPPARARPSRIFLPSSFGPGLIRGSGLYAEPLAALVRPHRTWRGPHFARLCVARDHGRCEHENPHWGVHVGAGCNPPPCLASRLLSRVEVSFSLLGSGPSLCYAPMPLALPTPVCLMDR